MIRPSFALWIPLLVLPSACSAPPTDQPAPPTSEADSERSTRAELLRLGREDQEAREGDGAAAAAGDTLFLHRLLAGDSSRTRQLRAIVQRSGWPSRARFGADAARAAWLVLQHSPDTQWQMDLLPTLSAHVVSGDLSKQDFAQLTDRVLVRSGQPQRYGSHFSVLEGRLVPDRIEDLRSLDDRRAEMGLPPMTAYIRQLEAWYGLPVSWPPER